MDTRFAMTVKNWTPPTSLEIKQLRIANDLTQAKAAHLCRIGLKTYQKWESGDASPSQSAWTIYQFELQAKKLGFFSLEHLVEDVENNLNK